MNSNKTDDYPSLDELVVDMFITFARFEYALKEAGFLMQSREAKADWHAFSNSISDTLEKPSNPKLQEAIEYILQHPPMKQMVVDGKPKFIVRPVERDSQAEVILFYVRRVRHNLFHGGKCDGKRWYAPERTKLLLKHSLTVLQNCLDASRVVKEKYM